MRGCPNAARLEHAFAHAQGREDVRPGAGGQGIAVQPSRDFAEQDEVDIAILEHGSRRDGAFFRQRHADAGLVAAPVGVEVEIGPQAGKMRHQMTQGDIGFAALEFGEVLGDAIVDAESAPLEKLHQDRRRGDHLGERGDVEDRVERHGFAPGRERAEPVGFAVEDTALVADNQDRSGQAVVADGPIQNEIERGRSREPRFGRRLAESAHDRRSAGHAGHPAAPRYLHCSLRAISSNCPARRRSMAVMPPASCVCRSTVTRL